MRTARGRRLLAASRSDVRAREARVLGPEHLLSLLECDFMDIDAPAPCRVLCPPPNASPSVPRTLASAGPRRAWSCLLCAGHYQRRAGKDECGEQAHLRDPSAGRD